MGQQTKCGKDGQQVDDGPKRKWVCQKRNLFAGRFEISRNPTHEIVDDETLRLANGSFGRIANLKQSGGDAIYERVVEFVTNRHATQSDAMNIARQIAPSPELYGILLDVIAHFNLAELYPVATKAIADINRVNLEPEISLFKIILEIQKCL